MARGERTGQRDALTSTPSTRRCHDEIVVAFSCKRRGICPSCTARRMADTAAHLVDRVLPRAPSRQWVFTVPKPLRLVLARDPAWTSWIGGLVVRALARGCGSRCCRSRPTPTCWRSSPDHAPDHVRVERRNARDPDVLVLGRQHEQPQRDRARHRAVRAPVRPRARHPRRSHAMHRPCVCGTLGVATRDGLASWSRAGRVSWRR